MTDQSDLYERIAGIAADRRSGATALVLDAIEVLRRARHGEAGLAEAAAMLLRAQPAMAGIRTATAVALGPDADSRLELLALRMRRAADTTARIAVPLLRLRRPGRSERGALTIVTCSRSALVEHTILELGRHEPVRACCAESRPGQEGGELAAALAAAGLDVALYTDAAIGTAVPGADAVLVGADAVSRRAVINKVGTAALAALARVTGVPVMVLAGREKILPEPVFHTLSYAGRAPLLAHGTVTRPDALFEEIPADVVDHVVVDGAALRIDEVEGASLWTAADLERYMSVIQSHNMLDSG